MDRILASVHVSNPDCEVKYITNFNYTVPKITIGLEREKDDFDKTIDVDTRTGNITYDSSNFEKKRDKTPNFINYMARLHINMMLPPYGQYILGVMGGFFVIALFSGVMIYRPFARNRPFAYIETGKSRKRKWIDIHNVLGISVLAWTTIVAVTGIAHTVADDLFDIWLSDLKHTVTVTHDMSKTYNHNLSVEKILQDTKHAIPQSRKILSVLFPGHNYMGENYFYIWINGNNNLTRWIYTAVIVDASNGRIVFSGDFPLYMRAIYIMKPLHFGDYGGEPLKIIWALLDIITIIILGTGIYLWMVRITRGATELK